MTAATAVRRGPMPRLVRRHSWDGELARYLESWRDRPFAWGASDCAQFVAGALATMSGVPLERILAGVPTYTTQRAASHAAIAAGGAARMEGRLRALGLLDVDGGLQYAQRGDVVLVDRRRPLSAVGLIWNGSVWTTHPGDACRPHPLSEISRGAILLRMAIT